MSKPVVTVENAAMIRMAQELFAQIDHGGVRRWFYLGRRPHSVVRSTHGTGVSSKGRTGAFEALNQGSNPCTPIVTCLLLVACGGTPPISSDAGDSDGGLASDAGLTATVALASSIHTTSNGDLWPSCWGGDETYVGGIEKNKHESKKLHAGRSYL